MQASSLDQYSVVIARRKGTNRKTGQDLPPKSIPFVKHAPNADNY